MISGLGCPRESWIEFLGSDTNVITLHEILEATQSPNFDDWGRYVAAEIERSQPESIVAHDFGGTTTLKALLELQAKGVQLKTRLTLLNTAFRDFDVLKNPHPFLMQLVPWSLVTQLIAASGGDVDPELKPFFPIIRAVYRRVIAVSFGRKIQKKIYSRTKARQDSLDCDLGFPAQIIASADDPYTSLSSLRRIQDDFLIPTFYVLEYGHFPYSASSRETVRHTIYNFEATSRALHAKQR
jgi:predicted alpha/beta hydrolase family esterase